MNGPLNQIKGKIKSNQNYEYICTYPERTKTVSDLSYLI